MELGQSIGFWQLIAPPWELALVTRSPMVPIHVVPTSPAGQKTAGLSPSPESALNIRAFPVVLFMTGGRLSCLALLTLLDLLIQILLVDFPPAKRNASCAPSRLWDRAMAFQHSVVSVELAAMGLAICPVKVRGGAWESGVVFGPVGTFSNLCLFGL